MVNRVLSSLGLASVLTITILCILQIAGAQVMTSPSYQLQSDSINTGGGRSTSNNYIQESTVGEIATGPSESTSYQLRAGYQQMQSVFLSMSAPANVVMDTSLGGLTGGTSNGSTTVTVITDSPSGYRITIESENDPAMQRGDGPTIADYVGAPDYTFTTGATDSHFGFTSAGVDVADEFADNGASGCGGGGDKEALVCWDGLSTTARIIAEAGSGNQPAGATTTLYFRVGLGGNVAVPAGLYTATTTLTAYPL